MNIKVVCATFAIALTACAVNPAVSSAEELAPTQVRKLSITEQVNQLRSYAVEGTFTQVELCEKIDFLVKRIDTLLEKGAENPVELIKQRKFLLKLKSQIIAGHVEVDELAADGNGSLLTASSLTNGGKVATVGYSGGGGVIKSLGKRGGGGGGGIGGVGTLLGVGGIVAAIAIPVAVSNGSDGGNGASPSGS